VIYSSVAFLLAFPVFCAIYWAARSRSLRLIVLLLASLGFYAYGEPLGLPLLVAVIALTYLLGLLVAAWPRRSAIIVAVGVAALLTILGYFKYTAFLAGFFGTSAPGPIFLPLGLSFFTFEAIAYLVDLKRGVTTVERSPVRLGLFIAVFPHVISGPIMRPNDLIPQLKRRVAWYLPTFVAGLQLFVEGLIKKRLLADPAGGVADRIFAAPHDAGTAAAWIAALAYTVQIYGDFAGYTDMGRGIARMLGLELPLNFNAPYAALSIGDFWRRWHISLSSWLRDYLYVPLGGNRRGNIRTYLNLLTTMLLGGLWHGAGLTFVAWGAFHGLLLALERLTRWPERVAPVVGGALTLLLVINGWVLFRAHDFATAAAMFQAMYAPRAGSVLPAGEVAMVLGMFVLVLGLMVMARTRGVVLDRIRLPSAMSGWAYGMAAGVGLIFVLLEAAPEPFIYFRF
jgi:alginate O-acetyltransferase complex protein AlgI